LAPQIASGLQGAFIPAFFVLSALIHLLELYVCRLVTSDVEPQNTFHLNFHLKMLLLEVEKLI
jgi:hypothetical protein